MTRPELGATQHPSGCAKMLGIRLANDDFGARYPHFNLLKRLPLDAMKSDRCFIRGIHDYEPGDADLLHDLA